MIACIIIVSLAFIWLGYETQWFMFYQSKHSSPPVKHLQSKSSGIKSKSNTVGLTKPKLSDNLVDKINAPIRIKSTTPNINNDLIEHNPVTFIPLDMPDIQGTVNIISKRL